MKEKRYSPMNSPRGDSTNNPPLRGTGGVEPEKHPPNPLQRGKSYTDNSFSNGENLHQIPPEGGRGVIRN